MELKQPKYELGQKVYHLFATTPNKIVVESGEIGTFIAIISIKNGELYQMNRYTLSANCWNVSINENQLYATIEEAEHAKEMKNTICNSNANANKNIDDSMCIVKAMTGSTKVTL